jgi:hypothetical protein
MTSPQRYLLLVLCTVVVGACIPPRAAAASSETGRTSYPASFFAGYAPQTALDIVARVPGFALDEVDAIRGFGSAAGNVLIDGTRPTSKSGGVQEALRRIPAAHVERVEVRGGTLGVAEAEGQTIVVNVVRRAAPRATRWQLSLERAAGGDVYPAAELATSGTLGGWLTSLEANLLRERLPFNADIQRTDAEGAVVASLDEGQLTEISEVSVSGDARRSAFDGVLRLGGRVAWSHSAPRTIRRGFEQPQPDPRPDSLFVNDGDSRIIETELAADWTRDNTRSWTWRIVSLATAESQRADSRSRLERPIGVLASGSTSRSSQDSYEAIFRTTARRRGTGRWQPEFGAELAYNRLDGALDVRLTDGTGGVPVAIPAANVSVDESRTEIFANVIARITPEFSLEIGSALEASRISVTGDAENTDSYLFWKPSAALIYDHTPSTQWRVSVKHSAGQLDFGDFAAAADLVDERITAGNPSLRPDQATRLAITMDHRTGERFSVNASLFREWRRDVLEQIPFADGAAGVGNAGNASLWGFSATGSLSLNGLIHNGLLEIEAGSRSSRYDDVLTGRSRDLSGITRPQAYIQFRQDLPPRQLAWGFGYWLGRTTATFFVDEVNTLQQDDVWDAFIETTRSSGLKLRLSVFALGSQRQQRRRTIFAAHRGDEFVGREDARRWRGAFVKFTVSGEL